MYIEHENEILGTVLAVFFALVAVAFIKLFWFDAIAPLWLSIIGTVAFGGVAVWALVKTGSYWFRRIKEKRKKE